MLDLINIFIELYVSVSISKTLFGECQTEIVFKCRMRHVFGAGSSCLLRYLVFEEFFALSLSLSLSPQSNLVFGVSLLGRGCSQTMENRVTGPHNAATNKAIIAQITSPNSALLLP